MTSGGRKGTTMNKAKTGAILGLIGILTAGVAGASEPYGQNWREEPPSGGRGERLGYFFGFDRWREFPDFRNFTFQIGPYAKNGAFGMVYRTHRHLRARRFLGGASAHSGALRAERALSENDFHAVRGTMMNDARRHSVRVSRFEDGFDFVRNVLRRLRGQERSLRTAFNDENLRDLVFSLESFDGTRRRYLFVYNATQDAATGEWICEAYDPHAGLSGDERFPRFKISGRDGTILVDETWARASSESGSPTFAPWTPGWGRVDPARIGVARIHTGFRWVDEYLAIDPRRAPQAITALEEAADVIASNSRSLGAIHGPFDAIASGMPASAD